MLRSEYDRFIDIASKELDEAYFLQTWDSDPKYPMPFAKIRLNGTKYIEYNSKDADIHKGIYVDIFPYDNISDRLIERKVQKYLSKLYLHLLLNKSKYVYFENDNLLKYAICITLRKGSKIFSYEFLHKKLYKIMTRYNNVSTKRVVTFGGASSFEKEILEREWIKETIEKQFEDTTFSIPSKWNEYLTHFYGDYMTPPPVEKRNNRHNIIECDLGNN